ncbi:uncharacterized protein LOC111397918 isoform X1 [Olea europaea var. sylvestris]|uniref:uncharacterized protein LOC111397918 isoform X1 n=1 Tax=Olea europaea var. sylvestris TaxID=158386 RepID=UPI000C1D7F24|nr:uncharacterized protein LOC111397918 isoform X1 [Olea europaea var. sylvestris]
MFSFCFSFQFYFTCSSQNQRIVCLFPPNDPSLQLLIVGNHVRRFDQWPRRCWWWNHRSAHYLSSPNCEYAATNGSRSEEGEDKSWDCRTNVSGCEARRMGSAVRRFNSVPGRHCCVSGTRLKLLPLHVRRKGLVMDQLEWSHHLWWLLYLGVALEGGGPRIDLRDEVDADEVAVWVSLRVLYGVLVTNS